jgi:hypothetical protein
MSARPDRAKRRCGRALGNQCLGQVGIELKCAFDVRLRAALQARIVRKLAPQNDPLFRTQGVGRRELRIQLDGPAEQFDDDLHFGHGRGFIGERERMHVCLIRLGHRRRGSLEELLFLRRQRGADRLHGLAGDGRLGVRATSNLRS